MNSYLIDDFLKKFKDNKESCIYDTKTDNLDDLSSESKAEVIAEFITYSYIKTTLGLIHCIDDSNNKAHILVLTEKGKNVIDKGGWISYNKSLKRTKSYKIAKTEIKYWFSIFLPLFGLYLGVSQFSSEKLKVLINDQLSKQSKQEQKMLKQILETKTDSLVKYNQKLFHKMEQKFDSLKN